MRPLQTQAEIEKREKRNKTIIGIVIITLLVLSTAGFALNGVGIGDSNQQPSNGAPYYNGQYWIYGQAGQESYFTYQKEDINFSASLLNKGLSDYYGGIIYIDSQDSTVLNEIAINLRRYSSSIKEACYGACDRDLPEKTCEENLIVFKESENQIIREEQKCVFIYGNLKTVDAFLYNTLGLN